MSVRLIAHTVPVIPELMVDDSPGIMELISYCGRVSNPKNQENVSTADGLVKYLIKHKHWSPFEMANMVLEIETTRDIARQILRHRSFSFQEFSQRYADPLKEELGFVFREARLQDTKNRQNSLEVDDPVVHEEWHALQADVLKVVQRAYTQAIDMGIAKEVARAVLPEGMTISRMYVQGTVRSWIHYLELRQGPETQKEHREIAYACAAVITKMVPLPTISTV